jgi:1-deoxy-D-xylulose-5-phosphate synthase
MAYEALNNAGHTDRDLIVILNDNEMSISPNVGAIHKYLTRVVTNPVYNRMRDEIKHIMNRTGAIGDVMQSVVLKMEETARRCSRRACCSRSSASATSARSTATTCRRCSARCATCATGRAAPRARRHEEGQGLPAGRAESRRVARRHARSTRSAARCQEEGRAAGLHQRVRQGLVELGAERPEMAVITAAMPERHRHRPVRRHVPDRYFDVGIAEGHGVTFAAGLATEGIVPVVAIYSTFLQRAYDSIIHDVAIQNLPVVFAMDRAGWSATTGRRTWGSTTSRTCSPCRT